MLSNNLLIMKLKFYLELKTSTSLVSIKKTVMLLIFFVKFQFHCRTNVYFNSLS